jgi:hypothetical protein
MSIHLTTLSVDPECKLINSPICSSSRTPFVEFDTLCFNSTAGDKKVNDYDDDEFDVNKA